MPSHDPVRRALQAKTASAVRHGAANASDLHRDLAAMRIEDYIRKIVASAPPLTDEQKSRLAVLLNTEQVA